MCPDDPNFISDEQLYQEGRFRDIPIRDLERLMKEDSDSHHAGLAAIELARMKAEIDYDDVKHLKKDE